MEDVGENVDESKALGSGKSWFAVAREMFEHPVVGVGARTPRPADPNLDAWQPMLAWQWLIREAAVHDRVAAIGAHRVALSRGQLAASQRYLARRFNWGHKAVREFLARLARHGMVEVSAAHSQSVNVCGGPKTGTTKGTALTVISIRNYGTYQPEARAKGTANGTTRAQEGHSRGTKEYNDTRIHRSTPPPRERDASAPIDQVQVNGVAIYGPGFTIDLGAVEMAAGIYGISQDDARKLAEVCARDWAANGAKPPSPIAKVKRALAEERDRRMTNDARAGPSPRPQQETARERRERVFDEQVFGGKQR